MDLLCSRCGEPWDFDSLHEEARARFDARHPGITLPEASWSDAMRVEYRRIFADVSGEFRSGGCPTLTSFHAQCHSERNTDRALMASAAYDLLGADLDGAAAMFEDAGL